MGKSPLILAALASEAVPGLRFKRVQPLEKNSIGAADSALLTAESGEHYIIRLSKPGAAGTDQVAELSALQTLGALSLPFEISKLIGETRSPEGGRALLYSFIYGDHIDLERLNPNSPLVTSLGQAIAAIHNLTASVIQDAGFPEYDPNALVQSRIAELDRALETGKIPAILLDRWERAFEDLNLFRFTPTVIHGSIDGESVMALNDAVTGIMGWSDLKVADPAEDLAWIAGSANESAAYNVLVAYLAARPGADDHIRTRAKLYSEFDLARWLLHALRLRDEALVAEAVEMLAVLAEEVERGLHGTLSAELPQVELPDSIEDNLDIAMPSFDSVETMSFEVVAEDTTPETPSVADAEAEPEVSATVESPLEEAESAPIYEATLDDDQDPYYFAETVEIVISSEKKPADQEDRLF